MNKPSPPPDEHKAWAGVLRARASDSARVVLYNDDPGTSKVAIFTGRIGEVWLGSTIGLMAINQSQSPGAEIPTEVLIERQGSDEFLGNILSTIAFFSMKDGWRIAPDIVYEEMVSIYIPETTLPHIMFVPIFRWNDMSTVQVGAKVIYPLLAIPISRAESALIGRDGAEALTDRLLAAGANVADWLRDSVA